MDDGGHGSTNQIGGGAGPQEFDPGRIHIDHDPFRMHEDGIRSVFKQLPIAMLTVLQPRLHLLPFQFERQVVRDDLQGIRIGNRTGILGGRQEQAADQPCAV